MQTHKTQNSILLQPFFYTLVLCFSFFLNESSLQKNIVFAAGSSGTVQLGNPQSLCRMKRDTWVVRGNPNNPLDAQLMYNADNSEIFNCEEARTRQGQLILNSSYNIRNGTTPKDQVILMAKKEDLVAINPGGTRVKPPQVFLDGQDGKVVQVFDKPGMSYQDVESGRSRGVAWPKVGDDKAVFLREVYMDDNYYDPIKDSLAPRKFYEVDVIDKKDIHAYLQGKAVPGARGFVDSENISFEDPNAPATMPKAQPKPAPAPEDDDEPMPIPELPDEQTRSPEECPPVETNSASGIQKDIQNLEENVHQAANSSLNKKAKEYVDTLMNFPCLEKDQGTVANGGYNYNNYEKLLDKKMPYIRGRYFQETGNKLNDNEELKAIDALARTIYGEMEGSRLPYKKATARVILNRAEHLKTNISNEFADRDLRGTPFRDRVVGVVSAKAQFSFWQQRRMFKAVCVGMSDPEVRRTGRLNRAQAREWREALEIATKMIVDPFGFKDDTKPMTRDMQHYTSGMSPYWRFNWINTVDKRGKRVRACAQVKREVRGLRIPDGPVSNPNRMRIWAPLWPPVVVANSNCN